MIKYAPVAGGAFTYAYVGYGPTASFICGWSLVIGYIAIVMIDIAALSLIFRFLFPGVFEFGELYTIAGWKVYVGEVLLMFAGTAIFGWLNYHSISMAGKLQLILAPCSPSALLLSSLGPQRPIRPASPTSCPILRKTRVRSPAC